MINEVVINNTSRDIPSKTVANDVQFTSVFGFYDFLFYLVHESLKLSLSKEL